MSLLFVRFRLHAHFRAKNHKIKNRNLQEDGDEDEIFDYEITVILTLEVDRSTIDLIGNEPFFKAGLEQSFKDFINGDPQCYERPDLPLYRGMKIGNNPQMKSDVSKHPNQEVCAVIGSNTTNHEQSVHCFIILKAQCRGSRSACQERLNTRSYDSKKVAASKDASRSSCDKNIYDYLEDVSLETPTSILSVQIDKGKKIYAYMFKNESQIDKGKNIYTYTFKNESLEGLNNINASAGDVEKHNNFCRQCEEQSQLLRDIYSNYGLIFNNTGHECEFAGINCNNESLVSYVWLSKCISLFYTVKKNENRLTYLSCFVDNKNVSNTINAKLSRMKSLQGLNLGTCIAYIG